MRTGVCYNITARDLMENSDLALCNKISNPGHSLNHLLPPKCDTRNLHERGHMFELPQYDTTLHKNSYIVRILYGYI